jgi:lipid-A-disaccharide synthase
LPHIKPEVIKLLKDCPAPIHIVTDKQDKWGAFKTMRVAMAVSGTVGLELAAMQIPHVIAYKTNFVTAEIVRRMVKVKYAHLANIMADREIVPEFLQENCVPDKIAAATYTLFRDSKIQRHDFANIAQRLGYGQSKTPSQKAAAFVLSFVS